MTLEIGQRIDAGKRSAYVVGECLSTTSTNRLYRGRRVFFNYRYDEREYYEASEDEWIEVWLRTLAAADNVDPAEDAHQRARLRYEATAVLGQLPGWVPEPVDWIEHEGAPLLVMSVPRGQTLRQWKTAPGSDSPQILRIVGELLDLLENLHQQQQLIGGFGPDDIRADETGRICFTATDRITAGDVASPEQRPLLQQQYPRGFTAPEVISSGGVVEAGSDLYSWSALFVFLLSEPTEDWPPAENEQHGGIFGPDTRERFETALERLARVAPNTLRSMSRKTDRRALGQIVAGWSAAVDAALNNESRSRPSSVAALRGIAMPRGPLGVLSQLWQQFRRR